MNDRGDLFEMLVPVLILLAVMIGASLFYNYYAYPINVGMLAVSKWMLIPFTPFFDKASNLVGLINGTDPARLGWDQVSRVYSISSGYFRWILLPLYAFIIYKGANLGLDAFNRRMMLRDLMKNNLHVFPSIAPAVRLDILSLSQSHGPWRVPDSAIKWVVTRNLLARKMANGKYRYADVSETYDDKWTLLPRKSRQYDAEGVIVDKRGCAAAFIEQLGPKMPTNIIDLPDYIRGLAAAFIVYGLGDRDRGYQLLGKMSLSHSSDEDRDESLSELNSYELDIGDADKILKKFLNHKEVARAVSRHDCFQRTWLTALLGFAREKGEVAPSRFLWLRPTDRSMWYALNQLGGKMPHFEAAAIWAHMDAEDVMGKAIETPEIKKAVKMIEYELGREGWIKTKGKK